MTSERWQQVKAVFRSALAYGSDQRAAFLDRACAGDLGLRREVESLLAYDERAGDFIQAPAAEVAAGLFAEERAESPAGRRVGPYQIQREIGRGGMGAVYLAERADQEYQKQVAIKVIKRGMDSEAILRRFRHERQILAGLDHPNIAKLLDGGTTEEGLPYFVLDYVEGLPIDSYCDRHQLSITERLKLFRTVCAAVQYAHQNLIVHRDLKPSNLLVTDDGMPKLLDFGIAKLMHPERSAQTMEPTLLPRLMTPEYASPEQVRGEPITTASDVYSLGVLLYELLTGHRPYQFKTHTPQEIERVICETEPEKPSTVIARGEEEPAHAGTPPKPRTAESVSRPREGTPERLRRRLRGDLDNIVLKALHKEPARRYASVEQLSEDIGRHLAGRPVMARKDTLGYRSKKFVQRNKAGVIAVALVVLSLVGGMITTTWQAHRAEQEWVQAQRERSRAERLLYAAHMNLASQAWEDANIGRVLELLARYQPAPGQEDWRGFEWYHLWQLCRSKLFTLPHASAVGPVTFSPDGKILASGSWDHTVKLWDLATRRELTTLKGHRGEVWSVAFSPDGKTLASGSEDGTVKLWDVATRRELTTLKGRTGAVWSVAFSPDGKTLASGSEDGTVKLWDVTARRELTTLKGHAGRVWFIAFSPDGKTLASGHADSTVKLWDLATRRELTTLKGHMDEVFHVAFSPDGKTLASACADSTVKLWDLATRRELTTLKGHTGWVTSVAFSPDGKALASGSEDSAVKLWDLATRRELTTLKGHTGWVTSVAFSPDGKTLASGSWDRTVKLWDLTIREELTTLKGHTGEVLDIAFSPDGKVLASGSRDSTVKLWDLAAQQELTTLKGHTGVVRSVAFSPDGKTLASGGEDGTVKLWDLAARQEFTTLKGRTSEVWSVTFSPDGKLLASGSEDNTVKLWDLATRRELTTLKGHTGRVTSLAFSPDGKTLASASGSWDGTVKLWDLAARQELTTLKGHTGQVLDVAFSPDGKVLASGSRDSTVKLWHLATRQELTTLKGHTGVVQSVAFARDGKRLATGSTDGTVKLWDVVSGQELITLKGAGSPVAFSPDSKTLAGKSQVDTIKLWHAATDQEVLAQR